MSDYISSAESDRASSPEPAPTPRARISDFAQQIENAHDEDMAALKAAHKLKLKKLAYKTGGAFEVARTLERRLDKNPPLSVSSDIDGLTKLLEHITLTVEDIVTGHKCPVPGCRRTFEHGYSVGGHLMRQGDSKHQEFRANIHQ
ncbi:hypothetical protein HDU88_008982 [Geranomyces variabilis]|nr:hypothetical protein HDU88_008982 [Geranomyces variabilis]